MARPDAVRGNESANFKIRKANCFVRFLISSAFIFSLTLCLQIGDWRLAIENWKSRKLAFFQMNLPRAERRRLGIVRDHDDGLASIFAQ